MRRETAGYMVRVASTVEPILRTGPRCNAFFDRDDAPVRGITDDWWGVLSLWGEGTYHGEKGKILTWHWKDRENPAVECRTILVHDVRSAEITGGRLVFRGMLWPGRNDRPKIPGSWSIGILDEPRKVRQATLEAWACRT